MTALRRSRVCYGVLLFQKLNVFLLFFLRNHQGVHGLKGIPVHGFHQRFDVIEFFLCNALLHTLLHTLLYTLLHALFQDISTVIAHVCHHPLHVFGNRDTEIPD